MGNVIWWEAAARVSAQRIRNQQEGLREYEALSTITRILKPLTIDVVGLQCCMYDFG